MTKRFFTACMWLMLDVLPAGPRPPMPSEILGSAAFDELLEEFRLQL